ncbi:hypothetical protein HUU39_27545 [candidate division KSB1 bacterium]|nr:hypothetical protein [candidate division KSB1 bacterium]
MKPWPYLLAFIVPLSAVVGHWWGGVFHFLTPVIAFVMIPLLDLVAGAEGNNLPLAELEKLAEKMSFRVITFLYVPVQVGLVLWGGYVVASPWRMSCFTKKMPSKKRWATCCC